MAGERIWPGLGGIRDVARSALESHGYDPAEHHETVAELETALGEAILDTVAEIMRERGLKRENEYALDGTGPTEPEQGGKQYGYRRYADGRPTVGPIPRAQVLARMREDKGVVPVERPGIPGAWRPWTDSAELARAAEQGDR